MKLFGWEMTLKIIQLHPADNGRDIICVEAAWLNTQGLIQVPLGACGCSLQSPGFSCEAAAEVGVGRCPWGGQGVHLTCLHHFLWLLTLFPQVPVL